MRTNRTRAEVPDAWSTAAALLREGRAQEAAEIYLEGDIDTPSAALSLQLATCYEQLGQYEEACRWACKVVDAGDEFSSWQSASQLVRRCRDRISSAGKRSVRVAILGSYTTIQLTQLLLLAGARLGVWFDVYECAYRQYEQDILDPNSGLYAFRPDVVVIAVHEAEVRLGGGSSSPQEEIEGEVNRWTGLWGLLKSRTNARVIQHNFSVPSEIAEGHLGTRLSGSRYNMIQALNARLGEEAGAEVSIVDCERLSAWVGKQRWFDPRYWYLAKQAVALDAIPLLARHTAAVISAGLGINRKCLVLDLDNTLWGGVIAEDGIHGVALGHGPNGEAFAAFQEYVIGLKRKGIILAVCSKNNHDDAVEPFLKHPDMRIKLEDIALFIANWNPKPDNLRRIAQELNLGLDSLVFVDDSAVECAAVRHALPEVDVIPLPVDPADYVRRLAEYLQFETAWLTAEDKKRADQYRARVQVRQLESTADSIEAFHRNLRMEAMVVPFMDVDLPRIAQLVGKTNQFNLTTRRHSVARLREFMTHPDCVHLALRLRDRFADHGLVSVMIGMREGTTLSIDTWLMSCRVIGRAVETAMLAALCHEAQQAGCTKLRGTYAPTEKNSLVATVYGRCGFDLIEESSDSSVWTYPLDQKGPITCDVIRTVNSWERSDVNSGAI